MGNLELHSDQDSSTILKCTGDLGIFNSQYGDQDTSVVLKRTGNLEFKIFNMATKIIFGTVFKMPPSYNNELAILNTTIKMPPSFCNELAS